MSLDTYLSILLGTLFTLIITIIITKIQTKKNKEGRQQLRKLQHLIDLIILFAMILTIAFLISSHVQKRAEYMQQIDDNCPDKHHWYYYQHYPIVLFRQIIDHTPLSLND